MVSGEIAGSESPSLLSFCLDASPYCNVTALKGSHGQYVVDMDREGDLDRE